MSFSEIIVISASINEDDSTIHAAKYFVKGSALIDCAANYIREVLFVEEIEKGSQEFNDLENIGKIVDFDDEGVYYYTEEFVYRFMFLSGLTYSD